MMQADVWAEIDLQAVSHNFKNIRRIVKPQSGVMAVLKANAYGHGLVEVAGRVLADGADMLGVARIDEAIKIREAGFDAPVLIFGHTPPGLAPALVAYDLTQSIWSCDMARALADAVPGGRRLNVHVKIDTGMGRLGWVPCHPQKTTNHPEISESVIRDICSIKKLPAIDLQGIYTHFATADAPDKAFADRQFSIFHHLLDALEQQGVEFKIRHAANSAAIIDMPHTHLDMVRLGIALYGYYPSEFVDAGKAALRPVMTLKSRIIHLKKVPAGFTVSYGGVWKASSPTVIATVALGYGDGYSRLLSSKAKMLVRGRLAPVAGRVCMDQTMLDVGEIPDVAVGDEVMVFGAHPTLPVGADSIAKQINTIIYEIVTGVSSRVPRVYVR